jgi:uncharacterized protein (TIGR02611 family)
MPRIKKVAKKLIVSLIGFPLLLIGIILIPLPGPGLIVTFLAALLLSLEFDWANKRVEQAKTVFRRIYADAKARADRIENYGESKKDK